MSKIFKKYQKGIYLLIGILLLILIWEIISFSTKNLVFPEFFLVLKNTFILLFEKNVLLSTGLSIYRIFISIIISAFLGYFLGTLSSFFKPLENIFKPIIYLLTSFPTASLIFILIIYTKLTTYFLVCLLTFPLIYKACLQGGNFIYKTYGNIMLLEGKYSLKNYTKVILPLDLPYLSLGLLQTIPLALKVEIMGEVFVSNNHYIGLGTLIYQAYLNVEFVQLFSLTLLAILFTALFDLVFSFFKRKFIKKFSF